MKRLIVGLLGAALMSGALQAEAAATTAPQSDSQELAARVAGDPDTAVWSIQQADPALPVYRRSSDVTGTISSVGSDTMVNLMTLWAEAFQDHYPNVAVQVQGSGSSTSPPALTAGTALFGPMSRRMKPREIEAFEARHGYRPTAIRVAVDALAVFVHRDNPLQGIVLSDLDAVFSATRRCGRRERIDEWDQLGLTDSWVDRPIQLYGRNSVSGTYGYFKDSALCNGDFRPTVNEQPGSASVVQAVATSLNGIGYSGMGYRTSGIRSLAIARRDGAPMIAATAENATAGTYPLARYLYLYINKRPDTPLPPLEREFVRMVLSRQGQQIVVKDGYVPLPANMAARELARLQKTPALATGSARSPEYVIGGEAHAALSSPAAITGADATSTRVNPMAVGASP